MGYLETDIYIIGIGRLSVKVSAEHDKKELPYILHHSSGIDFYFRYSKVDTEEVTRHHVSTGEYPHQDSRRYIVCNMNGDYVNPVPVYMNIIRKEGKEVFVFTREFRRMVFPIYFTREKGTSYAEPMELRIPNNIIIGKCKAIGDKFILSPAKWVEWSYSIDFDTMDSMVDEVMRWIRKNNMQNELAFYCL